MALTWNNELQEINIDRRFVAKTVPKRKPKILALFCCKFQVEEPGDLIEEKKTSKADLKNEQPLANLTSAGGKIERFAANPGRKKNSSQE